MTGTGATDPVVVSDHPHRRSEDLQSRRACTVRVLTPTGPMTFATYHPHTSRFPENKALDYARLVRTVRNTEVNEIHTTREIRHRSDETRQSRRGFSARPQTVRLV